MIETDQLSQALVERGVNPALADALLCDLDPAAVAGTLRWFDDQDGRVGAGVLVAELRAGGKPDYGTTLLQRQGDYGEEISDWLNEHFPNLRDESGRPHPGAIAAVIRLDYRDGKDRRSASRWGPEIRASVKAFEHRGELSEHEGLELIAKRHADRAHPRPQLAAVPDANPNEEDTP